MSALPAHGYEIAVEQPYGVEITTVDGIFIKQMVVRNAGTIIPQHSHVYSHASMLAKGSIFVWKDGALDARYRSPCALVIKAGVKHTFQTLEDDTIIYCLHNLHNADVVAVLEEHGLTTEIL
ncbi:MAG: hypothetical protein ACREDY_17505 [Bradyrhizobium sp.]